MSDLLEAQLETPWGQSFFLFREESLSENVHNSPIMSIEIEFDDICWSIMGRKVIVVDVSLSSTTLLVNLVSLIEGYATEVRWLPMAYERIYRKWHCVCKERKKVCSAWKSKNAFFRLFSFTIKIERAFPLARWKTRKLLSFFLLTNHENVFSSLHFHTKQRREHTEQKKIQHHCRRTFR
jgi:hypothetical protein